jgi:hypothetical protein
LGALGGDDDDGDVLVDLILAHHRHELQSVHDRHVDVDDHDVEMLQRELPESIDAVVCLDDFE